MHVEQICAQDATLEDMDRQGRASQAQADSALQNFREVSISLTVIFWQAVLAKVCLQMACMALKASHCHAACSILPVCWMPVGSEKRPESCLNID